MDREINLLNNFGITNNEAKVYITLLQMDASTGYKISKLSGIPRSKIYNLLSSLEDKGLVLKSADETPLYKSLPVKELISKLKNDSKEHIDDIEVSLKDLGTVTKPESIWLIDSYAQVFEKVLYQINNAEKSLFVQIYSEDLSPEIISALSNAEKRLHKFVVILFSNHNSYSLPFNRFYKHLFESDKTLDYGGRWINIVSDGNEVTYGKLPNKATNTGVVTTKNSSMVFLAQEYVLHDAYNLRTLSLLDAEAKKVFGKDLEGVRNIYFDEK
ncbi:TrmB family transcriptional regulator [Companilactobacillus sp. FL22-1]|uniref:TrmB family transcriptional regulator n=1 Tax=Companilactobacillus sp. FL22-1 TaxID=3373892 RepID=UPI0037543E1D